MFGKKKQDELSTIINSLRDRLEVSYKQILERVSEATYKFSKVKESIEKIRTNNENNKRDISYVNIIAKELHEKINKDYNNIEHVYDGEQLDLESLKNLSFDSEFANKDIKEMQSICEEISKELSAIKDLSDEVKEITGQTSALSLNAAITAAGIDNGGQSFVQTATEIKDNSAKAGKMIIELNRHIEKADSLNAKYIEIINRAKDTIVRQQDEIIDRIKEIEKTANRIEVINSSFANIKNNYKKTIEDTLELTKTVEDLDSKQDNIYLDTKELVDGIELQGQLFDKLLDDVRNMKSTGE